MTHISAVPARHQSAGPLLRSDRHETAAQWKDGIPWGGTSCQTQSERPKRGSRGSITAPKVAANLIAQMQRLSGPKRRRGSGWQDRGGMGTNLSFGWGWSSYAFCSDAHQLAITTVVIEG